MTNRAQISQIIAATRRALAGADPDDEIVEEFHEEQTREAPKPLPLTRRDDIRRDVRLAAQQRGKPQ